MATISKGGPLNRHPNGLFSCDLWIGAHAAVMQWPILTRDAGRYRGHLPTVHLITPWE